MVVILLIGRRSTDCAFKKGDGPAALGPSAHFGTAFPPEAQGWLSGKKFLALARFRWWVLIIGVRPMLSLDEAGFENGWRRSIPREDRPES